MDLPKSGWKGFKRYWRKDLFAGFVVSLIALPLGLGLAAVSGAPPVAGLIAAIVGGIVVSNMGGSFVTISGPGNGLAVATLAAITLLGDGNNEQGWMFTMAAIVVSGGIIFGLGLLRFGSISDFFPSSAVEGMLAAIGVIIMSKQLHIMLGRAEPLGTTPIELLAEFPKTVLWLFSDGSIFVALIGLGSLLIMILYSRIRAKLFHLVPAPMWVVILSILLSFILEWNNISYWLPAEYKIELPNNLIAEYELPDFGMISSTAFWKAVLILTLIASIETLLSIKGVEKLDVFKRRANTNKDLKAHGVATFLSGMLGGLNVVTVIARSSVNVNNGAATRASNMFHGIILGIVLLFLDEFVVRIPLPALAAILVYTGYRLASPKTFKKMSQIGWESLTTYLFTFFTTIATDLITGICLGIIVTLLLQVITTKRGSLIFRNAFRPNTLLYVEEDGIYVISVRKYANFLNFARLRNKMDSIPSGANIIVDFSLSEFIDNSVMERLHDYHELHERKGGGVEIVGLDDLRAASDHPFAPWVPIMGSKPHKRKVLSKRQKNLGLFANENNLSYYSQLKFDKSDFKGFKYFFTKTIDVVRNEMSGTINDVELRLLDVDYHTGEFIARESLHTTLIFLDLGFEIPDFVLHKEGLFDKMASVAGLKDINFKEHERFSNRFYLLGSNEKEVKEYFNTELISFFTQNKPYHIESLNGKLLIFEKERLAGISEIKGLVSFAIRLAALIQELRKKG